MPNTRKRKQTDSSTLQCSWEMESISNFLTNLKNLSTIDDLANLYHISPMDIEDFCLHFNTSYDSLKKAEKAEHIKIFNDYYLEAVTSKIPFKDRCLLEVWNIAKNKKNFKDTVKVLKTSSKDLGNFLEFYKINFEDLCVATSPQNLTSMDCAQPYKKFTSQQIRASKITKKLHSKKSTQNAASTIGPLTNNNNEGLIWGETKIKVFLRILKPGTELNSLAKYYNIDTQAIEDFCIHFNTTYEILRDLSEAKRLNLFSNYMNQPVTTKIPLDKRDIEEIYKIAEIKKTVSETIKLLGCSEKELIDYLAKNGCDISMLFYEVAQNEAVGLSKTLHPTHETPDSNNFNTELINLKNNLQNPSEQTNEIHRSCSQEDFLFAKNTLSLTPDELTCLAPIPVVKRVSLHKLCETIHKQKTLEDTMRELDLTEIEFNTLLFQYGHSFSSLSALVKRTTLRTDSRLERLEQFDVDSPDKVTLPTTPTNHPMTPTIDSEGNLLNHESVIPLDAPSKINVEQYGLIGIWEVIQILQALDLTLSTLQATHDELNSFLAKYNCDFDKLLSIKKKSVIMKMARKVYFDDRLKEGSEITSNSLPQDQVSSTVTKLYADDGLKEGSEITSNSLPSEQILPTVTNFHLESSSEFFNSVSEFLNSQAPADDINDLEDLPSILLDTFDPILTSPKQK